MENVQLYQVQNIHHGLMMVGRSGLANQWQLFALEQAQGIESISYVIDTKAVSKDSPYGTLVPTTTGCSLICYCGESSKQAHCIGLSSMVMWILSGLRS